MKDKEILKNYQRLKVSTQLNETEYSELDPGTEKEQLVEKLVRSI